MAIFPVCITYDQEMVRILEILIRLTILYNIYSYLYVYGSSMIDQMIVYLPQIRIRKKKMMVIPLEILKQNTKKNQRFIYHNLRYE